MYLIVGLGNPGSKYKNNRHNIGFMAVDFLHEHFSGTTWQKKFQGLASTIIINEQKCTLLKPETFMNLSGRSVQSAASFYKIQVENILVLHDELDISFGEIRIKQGGGHAGHNGLKSIDAVLGKAYHRIRIGISHPGHKDLVSDYVLSDFSTSQRPELDSILEESAKAVSSIIA